MMSVIESLIEGPGSPIMKYKQTGNTNKLDLSFSKTLKSMVLNGVHSKQLKVEILVNVSKFERGKLKKKNPINFIMDSFSWQNLFSSWFVRNVDHFSFVFQLVLVNTYKQHNSED